MDFRKYGLLFLIFLILLSGLINCGCLEKNGNSLLIASFNYYPENPTTNDLIQFYDESISKNGSVVSWYWDFDSKDEFNKSISTLQNPTFRYLWGYGQTFEVKLTVTDSLGNADSITEKIEIVDQTHLPKGDAITLEVLGHERKNYNLDGSGFPQHAFTCVWVDLKMTNDWDTDVYPTVGWDGKYTWGGNFYLYVNNHTHTHWGHSGIRPENTPEKLSPGESANWTVTFWIPEAAEEYKIKYAYLYDISHEWLAYRDYWPKEIAIFAYI